MEFVYLITYPGKAQIAQARSPEAEVSHGRPRIRGLSLAPMIGYLWFTEPPGRVGSHHASTELGADA